MKINVRQTILYFLTSLTFIASLPAQAGVFSITYFSRANCINNESITWDLSTKWQMKVSSDQAHPVSGKILWLEDEARDTHRVAAICVGCGFTGGWNVTGSHYVGTPSSYANLDPSDEDPYAQSILEENCDGWVFDGNYTFFEPCKTSFADSCNLDQW